MTAQAHRVGDRVTVKCNGGVTASDRYGFTPGFISQFGDKAIVERVIGTAYVLRFNNLVIAAMQEDIAATETDAKPDAAQTSQSQQPQ